LNNKNTIQVSTPQGDTLFLPTGSTPIDFAYEVHTEVGHSCYQAFVNGEQVPLETQLKSGDVVNVSIMSVLSVQFTKGIYAGTSKYYTG
jgi:GTP pyrophosphokinase